MKRGDVYPTKSGDVEIKVVLSSDEVVVRFIDTDYFTLASKSNICSGRVKDVMQPSVYGIGFIGKGKYSGAVAPVANEKWRSMLGRCYNRNSPGYERYGAVGVTVCEEWHNFQNFAEWYTNYKYKEDGWHLDKDILVKGNTLYSPDRCSIVPRVINQSIVNRKGSRGDYAVGVGYIEKLGRYTVQFNGYKILHYKPFRKNSYYTEQEAFIEYKAAKESYLVALAYEWKGRVSPKVLKALVEYEVEWND